MAISGAAITYCVGGSLILYSGIKGASIADTVKAVLSGNLNVTNTETISVNNSSSDGTATGSVPEPASNDAKANQATAKKLASQMGHSDWTTGAQWDAWVKLWDRESGWSITAANPTSDARGIAQNINGYGPDYKQGDAVSQITWGINYIAQRYGNPVMAWGHETQAGWY